MTHGVDLDRLADYTAGLLDGTPQAAEVAELIATRPDWAHAYAAFADAERAVRVDLADLGSEPVTMPSDVVARLTAALDEAGSRPKLTVLTGEGSGTAGGRRTRTSEARARRRRQAWVAAVAAAVVAFGGFGVTVLADVFSTRSEEATTASGAVAPAQRGADALGGGEPAAPPAAAENAPPRFTASGTNYWPTDVAPGPAMQYDSASPGFASGRTDLKSSQVPPPLRRLSEDPVAINICLRQVASAYGGRPSLVDFARFQNEPALIITLVDPAGRPFRMVVAGPDCGLPERGADVRYTTPVS
ncbi:MAG TPA: hypothetical protein VFC00_24740 [Micromonosporaceae bacterium]|nr:hypothetical protein [Micromonosporaceae bacterium]